MSDFPVGLGIAAFPVRRFSFVWNRLAVSPPLALAHSVSVERRSAVRTVGPRAASANHHFRLLLGGEYQFAGRSQVTAAADVDSSPVVCVQLRLMNSQSESQCTRASPGCRTSQAITSAEVWMCVRVRE